MDAGGRHRSDRSGRSASVRGTRDGRCCSVAQTAPTRGCGTGPSRAALKRRPRARQARRSCLPGPPSSLAGSTPRRVASSGGTWELEGADWTSVRDMAQGGPARSCHDVRQEPQAGCAVRGECSTVSAAATASDLFSDTWELAGTSPPTSTTPSLVGFTITPAHATVGRHGPVRSSPRPASACMPTMILLQTIPSYPSSRVH